MHSIMQDLADIIRMRAHKTAIERPRCTQSVYAVARMSCIMAYVLACIHDMSMRCGTDTCMFRWVSAIVCDRHQHGCTHSLHKLNNHAITILSPYMLRRVGGQKDKGARRIRELRNHGVEHPVDILRDHIRRYPQVHFGAWSRRLTPTPVGKPLSKQYLRHARVTGLVNEQIGSARQQGQQHVRQQLRESSTWMTG